VDASVGLMFVGRPEVGVVTQVTNFSILDPNTKWGNSDAALINEDCDLRSSIEE